MRPLLIALSVLALAAPAQAKPAPVVPPAPPTHFLSTEKAQVLPDRQTELGLVGGVTNNYGAVAVQYHRGLGGGEARGHVGYYQAPGLFGSRNDLQTHGLSLGGGYKHRLGTLGPFETAVAGYAGAHLITRPALPLLVALPLTWGGLTLQPRAYAPDLTNGLNGSSLGLNLGLHLGFWTFEITPAYSTTAGRLTYQWKTGLRLPIREFVHLDFQIGNDEFGVGVHPGEPENGTLGTALLVVF